MRAAAGVSSASRTCTSVLMLASVSAPFGPLAPYNPGLPDHKAARSVGKTERNPNPEGERA